MEDGEETRVSEEELLEEVRLWVCIVGSLAVRENILGVLLV